MNQRFTKRERSDILQCGNLQAIVEEFCTIYTQEVLAQRTRTILLFGRKCQARILQTFLGFELQFAQRRINCPDQSTARYLKVFAELGLPEVRIPYDLSATARLLPRLERVWKEIQGTTRKEDFSPDRLRSLYRTIRRRLRAAEGQQSVHPR